MARRQPLSVLLIIAVSMFLGISFVLTFRNKSEGTRHLTYDLPPVKDELLTGTASAPKLENATLKAELGNAAWKVLHTTMAKFPDKPTKQDSEALSAYLHLFARLYPCGDCARHFQGILEKYPPQVSSRTSAATWACHVHNEVNKRLEKPIFDCSKIGDFYDCGCADDDTPETAATRPRTDAFTPLELHKEDGLTRGG